MGKYKRHKPTTDETKYLLLALPTRGSPVENELTGFFALLFVGEAGSFPCFFFAATVVLTMVVNEYGNIKPFVFVTSTKKACMFTLTI
jgi:hypothetical protein